MNRKNSPVLLLLALLVACVASAHAAPAPSLEGTEPDGALVVDAEGHLVIDTDLRRYFDYYLSARGEISDAALARHVAEEASQRLARAPRAAAEASRLFARYLRYIQTAEERLGAAVEKGAYDPSRAGETWERLQALRVEAFGEAGARAFFGDALRLEKAALELQAARVEASTPTEREAARAAYEASLTAEERAARAAARLPLDIAAKVETLRARGASSDEIWAVRAEAFGPEAADRLAALDRRRGLD